MRKYNKQEINKLLNENIDELYIKVGIEVEGTLSININDYSKILNKGKFYIEKKLFSVQKAICNNTEIISLLKSKSHEDTIMLVYTIADLISNIFTGISPVTVSVLLVKLGINKICKDEYNKTSYNNN